MAHYKVIASLLMGLGIGTTASYYANKDDEEYDSYKKVDYDKINKKKITNSSIFVRSFDSPNKLAEAKENLLKKYTYSQNGKKVYFFPSSLIKDGCLRYPINEKEVLKINMKTSIIEDIEKKID